MLIFGLIFDVIILLFIIISVLLIYSLLMNIVEQKTHESGIMRMMGLSKKGYVASVLLQAVSFVIPSIIIGYIVSIPLLHLAYSWLMKGKAEEYNIELLPSKGATL